MHIAGTGSAEARNWSNDRKSRKFAVRQTSVCRTTDELADLTSDKCLFHWDSFGVRDIRAGARSWRGSCIKAVRRMSQWLTLPNSETTSIRVLLVCSERVIRAALHALIDGQFGTKVIGEVEHLDAALASILSEQPDVTLLDPDHYDGDDVTGLLQAVMTKTRIILLTSSPNSTSIAEALQNGAVGLVLKQQAPELLIKAITKVHAGELWLDRSATARLLAELSRPIPAAPRDPNAERIALLTRREHQVISLVGEGLRNSEVANRLCISEVTVRNHLTAIFRKLELTNRFQLVIYAFQHGLATLPSRAATDAALPDRHTLGYQKRTS